MTATRHDVVLGWTAPAHVPAQFVESLCRALTDVRVLPRIHSVVTAVSGPLIAAARTYLVERFLGTDADWLLQLDADMVFTPSDLVRLIESADSVSVPIVGGLYVGTGQRIGDPGAEAGDLDGDGFRLLLPESRGVVPVDFVGAGALLVHRSVFVDLADRHPRPQPWFQEVAVDGRVDGEDWEFCRRAKAAGYPVHVNADVRLGHVKTVVLRP